jgi:hypothetical protein
MHTINSVQKSPNVRPERGLSHIHNGPASVVDNPGWGSAGCIEVVGFQSLKSAIRELSDFKNMTDDATIKELVKHKQLIIELEEARRPALKQVPVPQGMEDSFS